MSSITTHILDVSRGLPAEDVRVLLERETDSNWQTLMEIVTDSEGRARLFPEDEELTHGTYRLTFDVDAYFVAIEVTAFYPVVQIVFKVQDDRHHHVPLLLSPFGYSTYRGS
ncbi:hydroxyisourate hydrolase [bacterium]|nr:MAG: hydroxyisourate hydrolase [bacterium]